MSLLEHAKRIASISPGAHYIADAGGGCVFVNRGWTELTGLDIDGSRGDAWKEALRPGLQSQATPIRADDGTLVGFFGHCVALAKPLTAPSASSCGTPLSASSCGDAAYGSGRNR